MKSDESLNAGDCYTIRYVLDNLKETLLSIRRNQSNQNAFFQRNNETSYVYIFFTLGPLRAPRVLSSLAPSVCPSSVRPSVVGPSVREYQLLKNIGKDLAFELLAFWRFFWYVSPHLTSWMKVCVHVELHYSLYQLCLFCDF